MAKVQLRTSSLTYLPIRSSQNMADGGVSIMDEWHHKSPSMLVDFSTIWGASGLVQATMMRANDHLALHSNSPTKLSC